MARKIVRTVCGYCSTGCNFSIETGDDKPPVVIADASYPVNLGKACPKGFQLLGHLGSSERATAPLLRDSQGNLQPVSWDTALTAFTGRFKKIQERYGNDAVAFLGTGQIVSEEHALLGALAKFGMNLLHGDGNTRQCMATAAVAYKQAFGFDSPPFTYKDFEESDVMIFVGSNPVIAHPVMWNRVKMNQRQPKILVIDPRRTDTANGPGIVHYPVKPKSDLFLLYGLANLLIFRGWINQDFIEAHTSGFEEFRLHVQGFTPEIVTDKTGLSREQVEELAATIHNRDRVSWWWMVGINQGHQAVRTAQAIINLAILTGKIGRPGTGANSITGQCNAMGSRLFSNTSSLFCGRDFANAEHRREVSQILNIEEGRIPQVNSLSYEKILDAVDAGKIKGLWIVCTNPGHSWIDRNRLINTLKKAEFVVVQDMFSSTATAKYAHLVLPAAGCGEKTGTFINSERRIGLVQKVLEPPGEALPDFEIFRRVARHWGCDDLFKEWTSPEAVFQILKRLSRGTPCDFSGITGYAMLDESGGIQWPFPEGNNTPERERRLFEKGVFFNKDVKAKFLFEQPVEPPETPDAAYPYVLLTGRGLVTQWHTLTRSDRAPILKRMSPAPDYVEISPDDAGKLGINMNDRLIVSSKRGEARARAKITASISPGQVFMPMHFEETNNLTFSSFDTYSRQPSYKYAAISVRKAD